MISFFKKKCLSQGILSNETEKFKNPLPPDFLVSAFYPVSPSGGLPILPVSVMETVNLPAGF